MCTLELIASIVIWCMLINTLEFHVYLPAASAHRLFRFADDTYWGSLQDYITQISSCCSSSYDNRVSAEGHVMD